LAKIAILLAAALILSGCWSDPEVTGSTNSCAVSLFPSFNPKIMDQCVAACMKCDHGSMTTCSTSCTLKGAR
jgi:hypothetical protein